MNSAEIRAAALPAVLPSYCWVADPDPDVDDEVLLPIDPVLLECFEARLWRPVVVAVAVCIPEFLDPEEVDPDIPVEPNLLDVPESADADPPEVLLEVDIPEEPGAPFAEEVCATAAVVPRANNAAAAIFESFIFGPMVFEGAWRPIISRSTSMHTRMNRSALGSI
jgi:hypothetical protein